MTALTDLEAQNDPSIRPYWRYEAIEKLSNEKFDKRRYKRRTIDPVLMDYAEELRKHGNFLSDNANIATEIFKADGEQRAEIESRVLAGQNVSLIAEHVDLPESVIQEYEFIFFDARRFKNAKYWLITKTSYGFHKSGLLVNNVRAFWCRYAIDVGVIALNALIKSYKNNKANSEPFSLAVYLKKPNTVPLEIQWIAAQWVMPGTEEIDLWLMHLHTDQMAVDRMPYPISKNEAMKLLQLRFIEKARACIENKPLPKPSRNRKRSKEVKAPLMATNKTFSNSAVETVCSEAGVGKVKMCGTPNVEVLKNGLAE